MKTYMDLDNLDAILRRRWTQMAEIVRDSIGAYLVERLELAEIEVVSVTYSYGPGLLHLFIRIAFRRGGQPMGFQFPVPVQDLEANLSYLQVRARIAMDKLLYGWEN